ncbi:MAG: hypothetical protein ACOYN6_03070 [Ignavibacteria bacterium]
MSELKTGHLGIPIGKHGKTVFRRNRKKVFTYEASDEPMKVKSEKAQNNRLEFGKLVRFSNFVNRSKLIKEVWKRSKLPGSASNRRILKYNHNTFINYGLDLDSHILPESVYMNKAQVIIDESSLGLKFTTVNDQTGYNTKFSEFLPTFKFICMLHFKDPIDPKNEKKVINIMLEEQLNTGHLSREGYTGYSFDIPENYFSFIKDYNTILAFPALITMNEYGSPVHWTEAGGIYLKGESPPISKPKVETTIESPEKSLRIEYN